MVVAGQAGGLCVWDLNEAEAAGEYHFTQAVLALAYSPSGKLLAAASQDGTARVFSSYELSPKFNELAHAQRAPITSVAFSPDEDWLATGCADGTARLWDSQTGLLLTSWLVHDGPVTALAFQPDGRVLATAAGDGKLRLWDFSARRPECGH